ncbi:aldo/keto reductase [Uliginosibacterium sp. 31-16]|uniref:potassium channel beta subunit family protein n=1 Tax=Uliginosibacterium sp. 31-16 TaxID=3068315 RepID=UPI00274026B0|nr:aldo/keto reductase [Uliginosibacterium sp. 31-16]MDP5238835.1 aldo/keto reductase [Uliginosibacterium sp. 31-16]
MEYRRLGRSGLKVSALSLGSWVTYANQVDVANAREIMAAARDHGVNFFDNAETYAAGESERIMGEALRQLGWQREHYVVSSKFFWGLTDDPNVHHTLNRKYLLAAVDNSLKRFGLDYLDLIYCHRPDPNTPIEETVWAMHDLINRGKTLYWGTSEWSADEIRAAWEIAERHHLHKPVMEQPQYNLFIRKRVEQEYKRLYEDIGLGLTTWSPLGAGVLTGKYVNGIPAGSRGTLKGFEWLHERLLAPARTEAVKKLMVIAEELNCTPSQLAIAWCVKNPRVSSVITGASRPEQISENMRALDVVAQLNDEICARMDAACEGVVN